MANAKSQSSVQTDTEIQAMSTFLIPVGNCWKEASLL